MNDLFDLHRSYETRISQKLVAQLWANTVSEICWGNRPGMMTIRQFTVTTTDGGLLESHTVVTTMGETPSQSTRISRGERRLPANWKTIKVSNSLTGETNKVFLTNNDGFVVRN